MKFDVKVLWLLLSSSFGNLLAYQTDEINSHANFAKKVERILSEDVDVSFVCKKHLLEYVHELAAGKKWALKMFDSSAKIPSGIFDGNLVELGSFDECLNIQKSSIQTDIFGKYCLGTFKLANSQFETSARQLWNLNALFGLPRDNAATGNKSIGIQLATCTPDACSAAEIQIVYKGLGLNVNLNEESCQTKATQPELGTGAIAALSFFGVVLWLMIASTAYDAMICYFKKKPMYSFLTTFSVLTNGKRLLTINNGPSQISCLHGIRVISTMWVIIGHRYAIQGIFPLKNEVYLLKWVQNPGNMFILGATVSVDTFFLLAGLVTSYMYMNIGRKSKFNVALYYVHRYLRLTPALAVIILIHVTLLRYTGSGPLWPSSVQSQLIDSCEKSWWKTLLYIQNYGNLSLCIPQSWYLAVDTQLFLLSPLLLIPLGRWPKFTLSATWFLTICSGISCFLTGWFFELNGQIVGNLQGAQFYNYMKYYYMATWTRAATWLIGIALGYFIFKAKQRRVVVINKILALTLWALCLTVLCTCVFVGSGLLTKEYDRLENSFYLALVRPAWSIAVGWVVYACVIGYGGPVNWFLSSSIFQIVSKFTYSLYLVHFTIIVITTAQMRTTPYLSNAREMYIFWGDLALCFVAAVILTLAFESPIVALEKSIFGKKEKKEIKEPESVERFQKTAELP